MQMAVPGFINFARLAGLCLIGAITFAFLFCGRVSRSGPPTEKTVTATPVATPPSPKRADTISISIVGDLMVGSNYPSPSLLPPESEGNILQYAMPLLKKTDLRIGNLESAVSDNAPLYKDCTGSQCYAFRTPYKCAQWYKDAGFDYMNIANNHSFDFGMPGVEGTLEFLKKNNIRCSGVLQHPYDTLTVRNTRIGFVSFAPHTNCLNLNDDSLVKAYVKLVRPMCNILIVFFHGGGEGASRKHTPNGHEMFLGQDRGDVKKFAHICIDAGADLVLGSGPHVVRGMDMYKNKLISYSLGNFGTYHQFNLKFPNNVAPLQQIRITREGVLTQNMVFSFEQEGEGIPVPDTGRNAFKIIRSLSEEDFGFKGLDEGVK
jgi:Bacterial capsule synthesis protein PGA_cap